MWRKYGEEKRGIAFLKCNVVCDEEYKKLCRMTAEKCDAGHIVLVCTVYGGRMQSMSFSEEEFRSLYPLMKRELSALLDKETDRETRKIELDDFFDRYTSTKVYKRMLVGEKR